MFNQASRYYDLETRTLETPDGRRIVYKSRRFLPQGQTLPLLTEVTTIQVDRLDLITVRTLGAPEQYWRICDANDAMNPIDLITPPGRELRVPVPHAQQAIVSMSLSTEPQSQLVEQSVVAQSV